MLISTRNKGLKSVLPVLLSLFITLTGFCQSTHPPYDKALADSLGADDYGMKNYFFVLLKTGSKTYEKTVADSLFRGHMNTISHLASTHKLIVAGPFGKNDKNYRGLFILDAKTIEEVQALLSEDPTIRSGLLEVEIYPWYGSAALPEYLKYHSKIEKKGH
ncbi:MAG TPA: YciI family protein [Flavisolibacter sp.]|nr:YciI family protein [Flavisolibacter sp.]